MGIYLPKYVFKFATNDKIVNIFNFISNKFQNVPYVFRNMLDIYMLLNTTITYEEERYFNHHHQCPYLDLIHTFLFSSSTCESYGVWYCEDDVNRCSSTCTVLSGHFVKTFDGRMYTINSASCSQFTLVEVKING